MLVTGYSLYNESSSRTSLNYLKKDASAGNRVTIYRSVPKMLAESPNGVGKGMSGLYFRQHHQEINRNERYRSLVNFHATILTESPWWGRLLYVMSWALLISLMLPVNPRNSVYVIGLAIVLCTFTVNVFSTIGEAWKTWLPLILITLIVSAKRIISRDSLSLKVVARLLSLSLLSCAITHLIGLYRE